MKDLNAVLRGKEKPGGPVRCPFHDDRNASAFVYESGAFHCFACAAHAKDIIDIVRLLHYPKERYDVGRSCAKAQLDKDAVRITYTQPGHQARDWASEHTEEAMTLFCRLCNKDLPDTINEGLKITRGLQNPRALGIGISHVSSMRGVRHALIAKGYHRSLIDKVMQEAGISNEYGTYRIGRRLIVPEIRSGSVVYYQARALGEARSKYLNPPLSKRIFGYDSLKSNTEYVIITEGPFDALPFIEAGYSAIALMGSTPTELDPDEFQGRVIVIGLDSDTTGLSKGEFLCAGLKDMGLQALRITPPYKDYGEWVVQKGLEHVVRCIEWQLP